MTEKLTEALTLDNRHSVSGFSSGSMFFDSFIKSERAFDKNLGKTFIWLNAEKNEVIGYYNIGVGYVDMWDDQGKLKLGGSAHLNFFALDEKYRGVILKKHSDGKTLRMSDRLFSDFLVRVSEMRDGYAGFAFVTLAATEAGKSLYKRFGFEELEEDLHFSLKDDEKCCIPMYMAIDRE